LEASDDLVVHHIDELLEHYLVLDELGNDAPDLVGGEVFEVFFGFGSASDDTVHSKFEEEFISGEFELLRVEGTRIARIQVILDIWYEEAFVLCEFLDHFSRVDAVHPLGDGHFRLIVVNSDHIFGVFNTLLGVVTIEHEVLLEPSHGELLIGELLRELDGEHWLRGMEPEEEFLHLIVRSIVKFDLHVGSTRTQKGGV